jgi:hypothetical protein
LRTRFGSVAFALVPAVFAAAPSAHAAADPRPRNDRPGLALGLGAGGAFPNLGAGLIYLLPLPSRTNRPWTLSASAGIGFLPGPETTLYLDGSAPTVVGGAATAGLAYGRRHRLCGELGYGAAATQGLAIEGIIVDVQARYGFFADAGYEFAAANGFMLRFLPFGVGYLSSPLLGSKDRLHWSMSLFVGWRLW